MVSAYSADFAGAYIDAQWFSVSVGCPPHGSLLCVISKEGGAFDFSRFTRSWPPQNGVRRVKHPDERSHVCGRSSMSPDSGQPRLRARAPCPRTQFVSMMRSMPQTPSRGSMNPLSTRAPRTIDRGCFGRHELHVVGDTTHEP